GKRGDSAASNSDASRADCILCARRRRLDAIASPGRGGFFHVILKPGSAGGARTFEAAGGAVLSRHGASDGSAQSGNRNRAVGTGCCRPGDRRRIRNPGCGGEAETLVWKRAGKSPPAAPCAGAMVAVA